MLLFCALLVVQHARDAAAADDDVTSKTINFVEQLKQNLKQNNDDYADMDKRKLEDNFSATRSYVTTGGLVRHDKEVTPTVKSKGDNIDNGAVVNRRAGHAHSVEVEYYSENAIKPSTATTGTSDKTSAVINAVPTMNPKIILYKSFHIKKNISRLDDLNEVNLPTRNLITTQKTTTKDSKAIVPKLQKYKKVETFSKFIKNNKDLFKVSSTIKETHASQSTSDDWETKKRELFKNVLRNEIKEGKADTQERVLPHPEMLDMAPARGGRIHHLRNKGRLCQRHVLMPEGPKYDSNGRWYVPEHRLVVTSAYEATNPPRLLLPRCCNCCKKSVLGCE